MRTISHESLRRQTLKRSAVEGGLYAIMVGASETLAYYYAVKVGLGAKEIGSGKETNPGIHRKSYYKGLRASEALYYIMDILAGKSRPRAQNAYEIFAAPNSVNSEVTMASGSAWRKLGIPLAH